MSHIQDVVASYRPAIDRFIEVGARYCALLEAWLADQTRFDDRRAFLAEVERLLPEIYAAALDLPETSELWGEEEDDRAGRRGRYPALIGYDEDFVNLGLYRAMDAYLGEQLSYYPEIHDPYATAFGNSDLGKVVTASVGDDLASVYAWVKRSALVWSDGSDDAMFDALFEWRFELEMAGGAHLVDVLRALHFLLHRHAPDDD